MTTNDNNLRDLYKQIRLQHLCLPEQYDKVLRYLQRLSRESNGAFQLGDSVDDLLAVNSAALLAIRGVGATYVDAFLQLQSELPRMTDALQNAYAKSVHADDTAHINDWVREDRVPNTDVKLSSLSLNLSILSDKEKKVIAKIERMFGRADAQSLLRLQLTELGEKGGFGKPTLALILDVQRRIAQMLVDVRDRHVTLSYEEKGLLTQSNNVTLDFRKADSILLDDVEEYLFSVADDERELLLARWGFHCVSRTLEDIAIQRGLTREAVRQKEDKLLRMLRSSLRIAPTVLVENMQRQDAVDIEEALPMLRSCFDSPRSFCNFLNGLCDTEMTDHFDFNVGDVRLSLLDTYFSENLAPIAVDVLLEVLRSDFGYGKYHAYGVLKELQRKSKLEIHDDKVMPLGLGRIEAAAQILLAHPKGLPWKDIVALMNRSGICREELDATTGQLQAFISDSEYLYLCGRGIYRHVVFHEYSSIDIPAVMDEILAHFVAQDVDSIHLYEFYRQASAPVQAVDYYDFREFVRANGPDYGFFFNGRSGVDGLGMTQCFSRVPQQQMALALMEKATGAVMLAEVAAKLPSNSSRYAKFLLRRMTDEGLVVRIDNMMYTTPQKAFSGVDTEQMVALIEDILQRSGAKIVECDVFRDELNHVLALSYTKYFYSALASIYLCGKGVKNRHNLFSCEAIPYNSLNDVFLEICDSAQSNEDAIRRVSAEVVMTKQVAQTAAMNWRMSLKARAR
jgi:hypothetical protein